MLMILTAFMLLFCENAKADTSVESSRLTQFSLEGQSFPSYPTFRENLSHQIYGAKKRVCILSRRFEDREIALALFSASRRAVLTALRVHLKKQTTAQSDSLPRISEELVFLGIPILEKSLDPIKMTTPTILAIDGRAWSISSELYEFSRVEVSVEPAAMTATEVCRWAEGAVGAKAATRP